VAREGREGDVVLLKASRGVKLEKALETWKQRIGTATNVPSLRETLIQCRQRA